jgi:HAD superfamily hydrolase (TIGR01509 family)
MIKAIVFDCFGVLASEGLAPFLKKYFGHDPELMQKALDLSKEVDAGIVDYDAGIGRYAKMADMPEEAVRVQIEHNLPNEELFAYIKTELKPRYRIAMLSNAARDWLGEIFEPEQVALFDTIVLSYQTGFVKPDARAYQSVAAKLGLDMQECVLIDDQPRYVEGAKNAGMPVILYESLDQMKRDLREVLTG